MQKQSIVVPLELVFDDKWSLIFSDQKHAETKRLDLCYHLASTIIIKSRVYYMKLVVWFCLIPYPYPIFHFPAFETMFTLEIYCSL